eukprot:TRINITY_DN5395_c0_g1_i1.p1 TRINITY_DN5395_c0_g1~~TRINITY_DN5395_c0_g1_i1.p1  ORF type:complete len:243 (-),score=53.85 TRINITY_DN5395_c0_g1_i1:125-853(-)
MSFLFTATRLTSFLNASKSASNALFARTFASQAHYRQVIPSSAAIDSTESGIVVRPVFGANPHSGFSVAGVTFLWSRLSDILMTRSSEKKLKTRVSYEREAFLQKAVELYKNVNKALSEDDKHVLRESTTDRVFLSLRNMIRARPNGEKHSYTFEKLEKASLISMKIFRLKNGQLTTDTMGTSEFAQATVYIESLQTIRVTNKGKLVSGGDKPEHTGEYIIFERKLNVTHGPGSSWRLCGKI